MRRPQFTLRALLVATYSINNDSELMLSLKGYSANWPTMRVYQDHSMLLLAPADGIIGGAKMPHGAGSFWPFRQIAE